MLETLLEIILNESKWPAMSIVVGLLVPLLRLRGLLRREGSARDRWLFGMNLYFAFMVGTMAFGHLLAVSIRHAQGTLDNEVPVPLLYVLGVALLVPSVMLARGTTRAFGEPDFARRSVRWNAWLGVTLVVLDPFTWPLALPALFNSAYALHTRRYLGWTIVTLAAGSTAALLVGSIVFFASGQSFEQFSDM